MASKTKVTKQPEKLERPAAKAKVVKNDSTATIGFEAKLWLAADKLRNNMDAAEYKHVVLGLIFLKYISDTFEEHRAKLMAGKGEYKGANPEDPDEYKAENVFWVPADARWSHLQASAKQPTIGKTVDDAMVAIERDNPRLKGVLPKDYARPGLDKHRLGELIDLIGTIALLESRTGFQPVSSDENELQAEPSEREWYAVQAIAGGWSRDTLKQNLKNRLKQRQGAAVTNFASVLPAPASALARETLKDPYCFDFLGLGDEAHEREIENALIRHITRFLLELGSGFAFVGRQFRLEVGGDEFFIDLLFYHTRLKCYVVIELKGSAFKPEHVGQLNFYLSAVDSQIKAEDDHPTIGLLLCKTQNRIVAEYALRDTTKPMGIAEYQLLQALPEPLQTNLPSIEELEAELAADPLAVASLTEDESHE